MVLDGIGLNITILLAGSAALLVGIGLGIQQTFNDFFSGIILLIDRTIQVGDVIEVYDIVTTVKEIGVRASTVITREDIVVLIPNSKFTNDKVINWSHSRRQSRFKVKVGVSYDSDVELVKNCLLAVAKLDSRILKDPSPFVRLEDFGDSSMDFSINFWSDDAFRIEVIRSDIRFAIVKSFRENKITIPFPQRDLYIKQGGTSEK
jgi:small-conductance mechanosensitive channel